MPPPATPTTNGEISGGSPHLAICLLALLIAVHARVATRGVNNIKPNVEAMRTKNVDMSAEELEAYMHVNPAEVLPPVKQLIANGKRDLEKLKTEQDDDAVGVTLSLRGGGSGFLPGQRSALLR